MALGLKMMKTLESPPAGNSALTALPMARSLARSLFEGRSQLSVCFLSCCKSHFITQLCLTLWDPMDCSMPGFPVLHHLLELAQTRVHRVGDAIQPSYPLSSPSPAFSLSQHQGLFQ